MRQRVVKHMISRNDKGYLRRGLYMGELLHDFHPLGASHGLSMEDALNAEQK